MVLYGCEKKGFAGRVIRIALKTKRIKIAFASVIADWPYERRPPPPPIFCAKSSDLPDSKALSFFESAKECGTVSKERG